MREARISVDETDFAALGIEDLVSLCRSAGLDDFEEVACHGDGAVLEVELQSRIDEDILDDLSYVDNWEYVTDLGETHLYLIAFTAPALSEAIADRQDDLVRDCEAELTDRGAEISLVGPQEAIRDIVGEYERAGVSPDLRKLGRYEGRDNPLDDLTDRQLETLKTAYEMGYYEVPSEASTDDIAAELGVDDSTVAEHLQRAERNLLTEHFATAMD